VIIRRLVLSLVLVLFASATIGVILGLGDAARQDLAGLLSNTGTVTVSPEPTTTEPTTDPTPSVTAVAKPKPKPTARAATPAPRPTAARPSATPKPKPSATRKPSPTKKPTPRQKPRTKTKDPGPGDSTGPLTRGRGGTVYLTFDDGPSPHTAQILAILSRTGSTATFFHLGVNEIGFPHADAAIRRQGSKVGNHTYNHPDLTRLSGSQLRWQLRHGPRATCFRPPYGATNAAVRAAIAKAGMRQVLWSMDTLDWTKPGGKKLAKIGRSKHLQNGTIILMHDGGGDRAQTVAALPTIIADLKARGFKVRALPYC